MSNAKHGDKPGRPLAGGVRKANRKDAATFSPVSAFAAGAYWQRKWRPSPGSFLAAEKVAVPVKREQPARDKRMGLLRYLLSQRMPTRRVLVAPATAAATAAAVAAAATTAAAAPAAATTAAVATAAAAATARAVFAGLGLVDGQGAAVVLLAVEGGDGGLGLVVAAHLDEAEALAPAGVAVLDDFGALDGAVLAHNCSRSELVVL